MIKYIYTSILFLLTFFPSASGTSALRSDAIYDSVWFYFDNGNFQKTIEYSELYIYNNFKKEKLKNIYNLLAVVYRRIGDLSKAIEYCELALKASDDFNFKANVFVNMATIYAEKGDYTVANNYYYNALNYLDSNNYQLKASVFHNIGYSFSKVRKWEKAIENYKKSIKINEQFVKKDIGDSYYNCALAFQELQKNDEAEKYFKLSLNSYENEYGINNPKTAMSYSNYASFLFYLKQFDEGSKYYKKALNILYKTVGNKNFYTYSCIFDMGKSLFSAGDDINALRCFHNSLISIVYNFNDTNIFSNPSNNLIPNLNLIEVLKFKSKAFENLYKTTQRQEFLKASYSALELSSVYIEKLRVGFLSDNSKLLLSSNENDVYKGLVRISNTLYEKTKDKDYLNKAFEFSEREKYSVLRDLRNDLSARAYTGVPDSITLHERILKEKIASLQFRIENTGDSVETGYLNKKLFRLISEQEDLIKSIENKFADYYSIKYENKIFGADEIRTKLCKDKALVEYVLDKELIYIFVITCDTFSLVTSKADSSFFKWLNDYTVCLHSDYSLEYPVWRNASFNLYTKLIQPIEKLIEGKELVIVPDGILGKISFEPLTTKPYKENKWHMYQDEPYLLYKYPIAYSFSATLFVNTPVYKENRRVFGGFAPDYTYSKDSLPLLPEALTDLKKIGFIFAGKTFIGNKANESSVIKSFDKFKILHFYTHGYEDTLNPSMSKMFLAASDSISDGYLYAYEVSNMDIKADLVVLVSCYSGSGVISTGEGIMSIGRSFFNAGPASLIISLWSASSFPSMEIIKSFYWNLLKGKSKTEALQIAKIKYLKKSDTISANPRYWSSLVLLGDSSPLFKFYFLRILTIPFIVVVFLLLLLLRKKLLKPS